MVLSILFPIVDYLVFDHSERSSAICFLLINEFCTSSQFSPSLIVLHESVVFASTAILF